MQSSIYDIQYIFTWYQELYDPNKNSSLFFYDCYHSLISIMSNTSNGFPAVVSDNIATNSQTLLTINMSNVSKLTAGNYLTWSLQIHALLDGYDLAGHIDGSLTVPPASVTIDDQISVNPAYTLWKRQDKLIYIFLIGAISLPLQPLVSRATTVHEAWNTLASTYAKPSCGHIKKLKTQLKNWKKEDKDYRSLPPRNHHPTGPTCDTRQNS